MKALHDESVLKMLDSLPDEVLDMQVGKFLEASETDPEMAKWADYPFEFSDKFNLVSEPALQEEDKS